MGGLREKVGRTRATWRYFRDPSASLVGKALVVLALFYVVWPADLIPDVPIVGWLDDVGVATIAAFWLGRVAKRYRTFDPTKLAARDVTPNAPSPEAPLV